MNPAKKKKILTIVFIILGLVGAIISFYFFNKDKSSSHLVTGIFFLLMFILFIWKLNKIETPESQVEFNEGVQAYIKYLEKELKITIPENYNIYDTISDEEKYKTVIMVNDSSFGGKKYYPIEFFKKWAINSNGENYIEFGSGQGKETSNIDIVKTFLIKNNPNTNAYFLKEVENLIDKKLMEDKK